MSPSRQRRPIVIVTACLVVIAVVGGVRVWDVRHEYGVIGLTAGEAPPQLPFGGRDYQIGANPQADAIPAGLVKLGGAPAGGEVYGAPSGTSVVLYVRYPDGKIFEYVLQGGP
jgi:hypothetical protein